MDETGFDFNITPEIEQQIINAANAALAQVQPPAPAPEATPAAPASAIEVQPLPPPGPVIDDVFTEDGLNIRYAGNPNFEYGRAATARAQPFKGIVFHYTGSNTSLDDAVAYGQTVDPARGGAFGYHFYIGPDGSIVQGAPLSKRTNHIKDPTHPARIAGLDLSNANTIGIALVGDREAPTQAQLDAASKLGKALQQRFGITSVFGHGELQRDKHGKEGTTLARMLRGDGPMPSVVTAPTSVQDAIRQAARETGEDVGYLMALARTESAFKPDVVSPRTAAKGLFQFTDDTWAETVAKYGALYGVQNASPFDARANALMAAKRISEDRQMLERQLGRQPTNADLYAVWFLGRGGGPKFLQALAETPDAPAYTAAQPKQVANNRTIFFDGARPRTVREVYELFGEKVAPTGVAPDLSARTDPRKPISPHDVWAPPPLPVDKKYSDAALEAKRMKSREERMGFWRGTWESLTQQGLTARAVQALTTKGFTPDPAYAGSEEAKFDLEALTAGLPDSYLPRFGNAVSREHMVEIARQAHAEFRLQQQLADAGWKGVAAQMTAAIADPLSLGLSALTGGVATGIATAWRAGQITSRLLGAAAAAGTNVGIEASIAKLAGDEQDLGHLAQAATLGAVLGAAFGPIGRNIALRREALELEAIMRRSAVTPDVEPRAPVQDNVVPFPGRRAESQAVDNQVPRAASVGAAVNPNATPEALSDPVFRAVQDASVPVRAGGRAIKALTLSEGGKAAQSANPLTRMLGGMLGLDTIGKENLGVNPIGADQEMARYYRAKQYDWRSVALPAYDEWARMQGMNFLERAIGRRWTEFQEQVTAYVREKDAAIATKFPEAVKRAGEHFRRLMKEMAEDQRDPWLRKTGKRGGSVAGAEGLEPDPHYVMRIWAPAKMQKAIERFGHDGVARTIAASIKRVRGDLDDDLALKFANAILRSPYTRAIGYDDRLDRIFSNADAATARDILVNEFGWTDADAARLIERLRISEPNIPPHLKHRIPLDEKFVMEDVNGFGTGNLAIADLLENNADLLMGYYSRKVAGRVALARQRFVNPLNGDVVVDGIKSDQDFETIIRRITQWHVERHTPETEVRKEVEGLRWMYERIKGVPDPAQLSEWAEWARVGRNYNFARMMGQIAFAQAMDVGRIVGTLGIRSFFQHIRGFKRIVNMDGRSILAHGMDHELESIFGLGTDPLRGFSALVWEEAGQPKSLTRGRLVDKAQNVSEILADVTAHVSGMYYVNSWLQLMVGRAAAQKFATMAAGKLSKSDMRQLRFLGLDDDMLDRVLSQVRTHFTHEQGFLFGKRVTRMNLDKWTDLEARAAFEGALFRWSRHIVQENDIGAMHRMMSHPVAQTLFQFRSYALTAWENQLLHGVANWKDSRTWAQFTTSMFSGALVYAVQMQLQAMGRSDAQEFLEKKFSPAAFGAAVFQRAGFSSLIPMIVDTAAVFTPAGPIFDARPSGQATDFIFGNPTFSLIDDVRKTTSAMIDAALSGRDLTQQELRQMARILFLHNTMPLIQGYSVLISGQPERR